MKSHYPKHVNLWTILLIDCKFIFLLKKIKSKKFFFLGLIKPITNSPANRQPTTYPQTHRPPIQWLAESTITFERPYNRNIFILQNTNTAAKTDNYTSAYYPKSLLVSIKYIRRSQLYLFFWFLNFNALLLPRYFKVTFFVWNFFLQFIVWVWYSFMR